MMSGACLSTCATRKHVQVSTAATASTQQCSREHRWLIQCQQPASSRANRWLGNSPGPFLVPLPTAVVPSRDTGARLSLSGFFTACQASHVGSCCDFPDGCLAPSSSPSGWTSSWSTKLGQHISLAPASCPAYPPLCPGFRIPPQCWPAPCLGDLRGVVRQGGCEGQLRAGTESRQGGRLGTKLLVLPSGWGGWTGWASWARRAVCSPLWL